MTVNESQGRYLIEQRLFSQQEVAQAWNLAGQYQVDLCEVFLRQKRLTETQVSAIRQHVTQLTAASRPDLTNTVASEVPSFPPSSSQRLAAASQLPHDSGTLGPYTIVETISQGGMGVIYRARHPDIETDIALKTMLPGADKVSRARFEKEIEALTRIEHANIVQILGSGQVDDCPYLAMELVEGQDLQDYLLDRQRSGDGLPDFDWICDVFASLAEALHACHEEGLIHRDIKPQNIMLDEFQNPILVDFGIAKVSTAELDRAVDDMVALTKTGQVVGTPAFMAPEQLVPNEEFGGIGPATDVWGLATTMFFALTGQTIVELSGTNFQVALLTAALPGPQAIRPETPEALEKICQACFIREASERPTMAELASMLRAVKRKRWGKGAGALALAVFLVLLSSVAAYAYLSRQGHFISFHSPEWTNQNRFSVSGHLSGPINARIESFVENQWISVKQFAVTTPDFQLELPIAAGESRFRIVLGDDAVAQQWVTNCDAKAPVIKVQGLIDGQVPIPKAEAMVGFVEEDHLLSLTVNGREVKVIEGRFSVAMFDADEKTSVQLEALDKAGNKTQLNVLAVTSNAVKKLKQKLRDRVTWNELSSADQDLIADQVQSDLGQNFQWIDMSTYSMGGRQHRLARFVHLPSGMEFVLIPGGSYFAGTQDLRSEEKYVRAQEPAFSFASLKREAPLKVTVQPLLVGRYETTEEQWSRFSSDSKVSSLPARNMTPKSIEIWLNSAGDGLRLPTELEWEWAARASNISRFPWGDEFDPSQAWFEGNSKQEVQSVFAHRRSPNAFGLIDMIGNVQEWTQSPFHPNYRSLIANARRPKSYEPYMTVRGGHHREGPVFQRVAQRNSLNKAGRAPTIGFRVVRSID